MMVKRKACPGSQSGNVRHKIYQHAVSDKAAALLASTGNNIQTIKNQSGADIQFDSSPSPVPGMKILLVRGDSSQIKAAISLVNQETGNKDTMPHQAQEFWKRWVEIAFPDLDNRHYFVPPIFVNRVPMVRQFTCSQEVFVLQQATGLSGQSAVTPGHSIQPTPQDSDARDDDAMQRVFFSLKAIADHNGDIQVALTQLLFGKYLGQESYAAAAEQFPRPSDQSLPRTMKRGDFDVLIIHRLYGLIVCEVKAFNITHINQQDVDGRIREKLRQVVLQLNKAQAVLSHLVSDIAPGLRITKTMIFPNLASCEVQRSLAGDSQLTEDLRKCLDAPLSGDVTDLCLFSDKMCDLRTPEISNDVLKQLTDWWQRRVTEPGPDDHMTSELYKTLFARFCGPATTVSVSCTSSPRLCIKTLSDAVWFTGECYAQITLFPEQVKLLNLAPPRVFLSGPPGTGKTVVLQLMATEWQGSGNHVHILSTWHRSRSACRMLCHLLQQTRGNSGMPLGQVFYKQYDFIKGRDTERAVMEMTKEAEDGFLYVIADEVGYDDKKESEHFEDFCVKLLRQVPNLHLWVASFYHGLAPPAWQEKRLTIPLRSPPAVVREVEKDKRIGSSCDVLPYSQRPVPDHTEGPSVNWIRHRGQGHTEVDVRDCEECSQKVVSFLTSLRLSAHASISNDTAPSCLQYKDVLVLYWGALNDKTMVVMKIMEAGIPVKVMRDKDDENDVATAGRNVVWVADGARVRGLERKVIVCLGQDRFHAMSRCTSQLVVVSS